jgi:hypothetical protein
VIEANRRAAQLASQSPFGFCGSSDNSDPQFMAAISFCWGGSLPTSWLITAVEKQNIPTAELAAEARREREEFAKACNEQPKGETT